VPASTRLKPSRSPLDGSVSILHDVGEKALTIKSFINDSQNPAKCDNSNTPNYKKQLDQTGHYRRRIEMDYTEPKISNSALLTVDTQCDFALPDAVAEIPGTINVIPNMKSLLTVYRACDLPVIHIVRLYLPDGSNVDLCRKKTVEAGMTILAPHTAGAEIVTDLKPNPSAELDAEVLLKGEIQTWGSKEYVIYKPRWGAFFQTPLHRHLAALGVDTLVFCGCNFPNCPRTTIYEASERDYRIVLVEDAISGIYEEGKKELQSIGVRTWTTQMVIEKMDSGLAITSNNLSAPDFRDH
jgi:nicotinamidase-related amidase